MNIVIESSWKQVLAYEFEKVYFKNLINSVREEYKNYTCYPKGKDIFRAFDACPFKDLKVVIIGQDPYHGPYQANGLCFSVQKGMALPPSLVNIYKELEKDLGIDFATHGDLINWANQGVLLLNSVLSVRAHQAASHQKLGWESFTNLVIEHISAKKEGVVFLLWGGFAKKKAKLIDATKHHILTSGHPSPLSANRGFWFGNKHFSETNKILAKQNKSIINWQV
ncbi:uracil-DNA glycosylase [Psychroflexus salis]|uniref:Uracil-DNA glycosylase n=1 Tax=Psychroflexus salis TaxID=1526574 RepID=A0A916ZVK8_9FLAO|nr:uracil-DNA glycosylase [Psychroflexus salis]GGE14850.1 uracil-DNA glycosylase 2 [Psychroflexus salis]